MRHLIRLLLIIPLLIWFSSCKEKEPIKVDPAYSAYIQAFTAGIISAASPVVVQFSSAVPVDLREKVTANPSLFSIEPEISGSLSWDDAFTLRFSPEGDLPHSTAFEVTLRISEFCQVEAGHESFRFGFRTMDQNLDVRIKDLRSYRPDDLTKMYIGGALNTWDVANIEETEQCLEVLQNGRNLPITWSHDVNRRIHSFIVDSIIRTEKAGEVELLWNGKALGVKTSGKELQEIPALGDFKILQTKVFQSPEQYIEVIFSDPLDAAYELQGLVALANRTDLRTIVDLNTLRIYPPYRMSGNVDLELNKGIRNILGYPMKEDVVYTVLFEELKPAVRMLTTEKTILPSTEGLYLPFEAVSLSAVDVRVIRIYEQNVPHFLQVNDLNGNYDLKRAGRLIKSKQIRLDEDGKTNLSEWNRFHLDLKELIGTERGAIYRIEIGFRQAYAVYHCEEAIEQDQNLGRVETWDESEGESSYWDFYDNYYYYEDYYDGYYWDYDYRERDNPCDKAYYLTRRAQGVNILASDLGVIAKETSDGQIHCVVTNLLSATPVQGANVELLNYQTIAMASANTNRDGFASFDKPENPVFIVQVSHQGQKSYLKLDRGSSLSLSTFDVSGSAVEKGIKGFIYGERGVWRPGDTLFLGFILEDRQKVLPANHPVSMELVDPLGKIYERRVLNKGFHSFYPFHVATHDDSPTGTWQLRVKVGGAKFAKSIPIETIKPNRLKIGMDFGKDLLTADDQKINGKIQLKWLHGAIAGGLRVQVNSIFTPINTQFNTHRDFHFDDPVRKFYAEEQTIFDSNVDANGEANVSVNLDLSRQAPGMLKAHFNTKAFEQGGEFSVDRFSLPFSPYTHYAGLRLPKGDKARGMLLTDQDHKVDVVSLNSEGKASPNREISYSVYQVQWRWWWERNEDDLSRYAGSEGIIPLQSGTITTNSKGEGSFKLRVDYPSWGRYLVRIIDNESGHASGQTVYMDWPGWAGRAERENPGAASMLVFSTDKDAYQVGEECEVSFPSSGIGRALISIESGSSIVDAFWVEPQKEQTRFRFKVTPEMAPNVYVHITLVQPHGQKLNDLPIRLYGIVPVLVEDPQTHLYPQIRMADELAPESGFEVKVSEKSGKAMTYTLAVVDEGLLDLTRFETPDPWDHFYARAALGVTTWDMFDDVIGAWGAELERLLAIGGGAEINKQGLNKANRFKPVVMYLGPYELQPGKTASHKLHMPNYVGSVRTMVIAGNDRAYGAAEKTTPVRTPLMVLATLPRTLSPGSTLKLPVTVFAMDDKIKTVKAEVKVNGVVQLKGPSVKELKFSRTGDQVVNFDLNIPENEGIAKVEVIVSSGNESSRYEAEVQVSNPNPVVTELKELNLESGAEGKLLVDLPGMNGTNEVYLELSGIPNIDFGRRLDYLLGYPHGCAEQTTSKAFPQLFLPEVMELDERQKERREQNIRNAIDRLQQFQNISGGLAYWPGQTQTNDWATSYAGHFLLEASKKGFVWPEFSRKKWVSYQQETARNWRPGSKQYHRDDLEQAYRLYTLAMAGYPEIGAMNRLKERSGISNVCKWQLAAAYAIAGKTDIARSLMKGLDTAVESYAELSGTFGSSLRDKALVAEALLMMNERSLVADIVRDIARDLNSANWYSTQSTAFGLLAISRYAGGLEKREVKGLVSWNGDTKEYRSNKLIRKIKLSASQLKGNQLELKNSGQGPLYARLVMQGQPLAGNDRSAERELSISVVYKDMGGKVIDVSRLPQGMDFRAEVTVKHPGIMQEYENLSLEQVFPSGWEILSSRLGTGPESLIQSDVSDYRDIRDDRLHTYFDLPRSKSKTFVVLLNASYQGRYYLPAVNCEAMYDAGIFARKAGQWVEVVSPESAGTASK